MFAQTCRWTPVCKPGSTGSCEKTRGEVHGRAVKTVTTSEDAGRVGWEAGTRTPIARSRVWSPTIGRPPRSEIEFTSATPPKSNHILVAPLAQQIEQLPSRQRTHKPTSQHNSLRTCALA